jgi:hypothetical protein
MIYIHIHKRTKKTPLEINFIYLGNKEIYCIFKTCHIISVHFPHNCVYFKILSFSVWRILTFWWTIPCCLHLPDYASSTTLQNVGTKLADVTSQKTNLKYSTVKALKNLSVPDFNFPQSPTLIPPIQLFVTGANEPRWDTWQTAGLPPLSCYCTEHSPFSQALSFIKWDWMLLYFMEWDSPLIK